MKVMILRQMGNYQLVKINQITYDNVPLLKETLLMSL